MPFPPEVSEMSNFHSEIASPSTYLLAAVGALPLG